MRIPCIGWGREGRLLEKGARMQHEAKSGGKLLANGRPLEALWHSRACIMSRVFGWVRMPPCSRMEYQEPCTSMPPPPNGHWTCHAQWRGGVL